MYEYWVKQCNVLHNIYVNLGKLRACMLVFFKGNQKLANKATNIGLAKTNNFLYTTSSFYFLNIIFKSTIK